MQTLVNGNTYVTVLINKSTSRQKIALKVPGEELKPDVIFPEGLHKVKRTDIEIGPEMTIVIKWS